ncbi:hypothetical protein [Leptospirillum ferriphilum]|uniref:hypothetical protein n=1 Tax=Leptospirillum ferriphilum TaxID=178606 RepID=UPI0015C3FE96|nr:hypothetical protein [Leptospirillum ferriphilum]
MRKNGRVKLKPNGQGLFIAEKSQKNATLGEALKSYGREASSSRRIRGTDLAAYREKRRKEVSGTLSGMHSPWLPIFSRTQIKIWGIVSIGTIRSAGQEAVPDRAQAALLPEPKFSPVQREANQPCSFPDSRNLASFPRERNTAPDF